MLILDAIRESVAPIEQCVHGGDVFGSGQSLDNVQRAVMRHVLRPMLPERFGLGISCAFSVDDVHAHDEGILIYDAQYALPLGDVMPCENVYAQCTVATDLNEQAFTAAVLSIASLKQLSRIKATAYDVTPTTHLGVFGARYAQLSDDKLNPYLGYILADAADDPAHLLEHMNKMIEEQMLKPEHTPDVIVSFRDGWIISRQTRTGEMAVPRSSFARFGIWHANENLLPLLYTLLNVSLSQIHLRGADLLRPLAALSKQK